MLSFPLFALRVLALCVRCVLILFLDFRFVIQTRENTAPKVVTKKKHLFETRERFEKESRRFASPLQKTTTTTTTTRAFEKTFSFVRTRRDFFVEEGGEPRAYTRALLKRERERRNFQR